jgi:FkbM family methyltransferase
MANWHQALSSHLGTARGIIHVGAYDGAEAPLYRALGLTRQLWIEPQTEMFSKLAAALPPSPDVHAIQAACGASNGMAKMTVMRGMFSSSLLRPKTHLTRHPEVAIEGEIEVRIARLDDILRGIGARADDYNVLVMDAQGYELECLKGAEATAAALDIVISEVNAEELYEGCALVQDLDAWLSGRGFTRAWTDWNGPGGSYGDALYAREDVLDRRP